jgi:predicted P-loop ATPase
MTTQVKPKTFNADLAHLPAALIPLTGHRRWVVWRWEWREDKSGKGRWTKPPRMAHDPRRYAKTNDPTTWGSYADAVGAVTAREADGIGYMLLMSDIVAADLDHSRNPETGNIDPWAAELIAEANGAYVEITVSGAGLRIIGTGNGPETHRKFTLDKQTGAGIELYRNTARYITISGNQLGRCDATPPPFDNSIDSLLKRYTNGGANKHPNDTAGDVDSGIDLNKAKAKSPPDFDDVIKNGAPEGKRSELFQACVWHLATKGMNIADITNELGRHIHGIGAKYSGRLGQEVERSYTKWQENRKIKVDADNEADNSTEPEEPKTWDERDRHNKPKPTRVNARRAIVALNVKCRYDVFHDRLVVEGKIITRGRANLDHVALELREKIHRAHKFDPGAQNTIEALTGLCLDHSFDPVVDYLNGLTWDGTPRLDRWLITYCGAEDTELNHEFGRLALIAAVRRARRPGTKFDPIIVLEGAMGTNKSKAIEVLAGVENFSDQSIFGARDREQQELLAGVWLYEIAELSNIRRTEIEHIKAFASRTHDRARPAYGRVRVDQPRRCVLFATTNDSTYLKEADRRFWPVKTGTIDIAALRHDRNQLWAEAAAMEPGADTVLVSRLWTIAGAEQEARREHDPWDDKLTSASGTVEQNEERVSSTDLLEIVLGIHISKQRDVDYKRLGRCMRRLGWNGPKPMRIGGNVVKGFARPEKRANKQ